MAVSLHGAMMLFLTLVATASFTNAGRRAVFLILICHAIWAGDLLGEIPFYTGTLLADVAISLNLHHSSATDQTPLLSFRKIWTSLVLVLALFLASYPPDSPERAGWSSFLTWQIGIHVFPRECIPPVAVFMSKR